VITQLGELSIAAAVPLLAGFSAGLSAANAVAIPQLQGQLLGLNAVLGAITVAPPSLGATITAALGTVASLQAAVGGPTVTLQPAAIAGQISALTASLNALIASAAALTIPSANASIYVFDGSSDDLGAELQSAINGSLPGVGGHANALILATTSPSAWAALQLVFET
jgi:hypothetical protein